MHVSCRLSGMLLARLARPEVSNCILGLQQYSQAYEEASGHAILIEEIYERRKQADTDYYKFEHLAAAVLRANQDKDGISQ